MTGLSPRDDARSVIRMRADDVLRIIKKERQVGEYVVADHNQTVAFMLLAEATWLDRVPKIKIEVIAALKAEGQSHD